jgi:serine/threonine protein kinase
VTTPIPDDLSTALSERYELRRVLGRGGMATVYLAQDRKHHREVALKVLLPSLAAFLGVERFLKEIEIVARLTHPHILPLHDSGEAGGFLYYVMPYVQGGSLRDRMLDGRQFPLSDALEIVRPVADALGYAHSIGVLHRDIKPENILFSQGHPIVGDFGIARAVSTAGGSNLTRTGFPLGTPGYMSPEQAAGLTDLDEQTDVYSLAVVIYEMLSGELPGRWPTEDAVRSGRFEGISAPARTAMTRAGAGVEAALVRSLAIRQDQRTPSPASLVAELSGQPVRRPRYSAEQVQDIVGRAAQLEASAPTASGAMTLGGVEALGAEVGIAPEKIREAAALARRSTPSPLTQSPGTARNRWLNGPTRIVLERVVKGELPESDYTTLVDEIRMHLNAGGQVNQLGRSFTWSPTRSEYLKRDLEVIVTVRGGWTRITIMENMKVLAGSIFGGIGGGLGGGGMGPILGVGIGALGLNPIFLIGLIPAWLSGVYATARTVYRRQSDKRAVELEELANRLEQVTKYLIG